MRGVESDETKEDEKDTVWVGKITNYASKYADLAQGGEIFVDSKVYKELSKIYKQLKEGKLSWDEVVRAKGNKNYYGYIISNFYVENIDEFKMTKYDGLPIESEYQNPFDKLFDTVKKQTTNLVLEISKESARLAKKEEDLKRLERELKIKEGQLKKREKDLDKRNEQSYIKCKDIFSKTFCKSVLINELSFSFWSELIDLIFSLGRLMGKTTLDVKKNIDCYAFGIYFLFDMYEKAYEYLLIQAEYNSWLTPDFEQVIKKVKTKYQLVDIIKKRVDNAKDQNEREKYQDYLNKINVISII